MQRPTLLNQPDTVLIQHHLDALMGELKKFMPPGADVETQLTLALIGVLCQLLDTQKVHDVVRALGQDPKFWAQQAQSKAGKIIL